jgi:hypothetical protein
MVEPSDDPLNGQTSSTGPPTTPNTNIIHPVTQTQLFPFESLVLVARNQYFEGPLPAGKILPSLFRPNPIEHHPSAILSPLPTPPVSVGCAGSVASEAASSRFNPTRITKKAIINFNHPFRINSAFRDRPSVLVDYFPIQIVSIRYTCNRCSIFESLDP